MAERGPDGRFAAGNQISASRSEPIVPADWTPPASAGPARGYSWPPFAAGHEINRRHGATTDRITAPLVRSRVAGLLELAAEHDSPIGYLLDPSYAPAIEGWARAETQEALVAAWLEAKGSLFDEEGKPWPAVDVRRRLGEQAANLRARLGLDPLSRSRLFGNLAEAQRDRAAAEAQARLRARAAEAAEGSGEELD